MAIFISRKETFTTGFGALVEGRNEHEFKFRSAIDQALCDLHIVTSNFPGIPPLITRIKLQSATGFAILNFAPGVSVADIDLKASLGNCVFTGELLFVTLTFNRDIVDGDQVSFSPTNAQGVIVVA